MASLSVYLVLIFVLPAQNFQEPPNCLRCAVNVFSIFYANKVKSGNTDTYCKQKRIEKKSIYIINCPKKIKPNLTLKIIKNSNDKQVGQ